MYLSPDSMSVVRVHCWNLRTQLDQHPDADSSWTLPSHFATSSQPLLHHCSSYSRTRQPVVVLGSSLGSSSTHRLGTVYRRRFSGKMRTYFIFFFHLIYLTLSPPIPSMLYTLPYWSNAPFLIFDIRALWRSVLSARAPECQKLKMVG